MGKEMNIQIHNAWKKQDKKDIWNKKQENDNS